MIPLLRLQLLMLLVFCVAVTDADVVAAATIATAIATAIASAVADAAASANANASAPTTDVFALIA